MSASFEEALRQQIEANPERILAGNHVLRLLNLPPSRRRERALHRLENHARVELGIGEDEDVDWTAPNGRDWSSFFDALIKFLTALLPLIAPFIHI